MDTILLIMILSGTGVGGYALGIRHACRELTVGRSFSVVPERRKAVSQTMGAK